MKNIFVKRRQYCFFPFLELGREKIIGNTKMIPCPGPNHGITEVEHPDI